jgi:hypothetical protein
MTTLLVTTEAGLAVRHSSAMPWIAAIVLSVGLWRASVSLYGGSWPDMPHARDGPSLRFQRGVIGFQNLISCHRPTLAVEK